MILMTALSAAFFFAAVWPFLPYSLKPQTV
jgi:hypothetical protein